MSFSDGFIKILDALCDKFGIVIDWTSDVVNSNILPYANQLAERIINYEIVTSVVWMVIWGVLGFAGKKLCSLSLKWEEESGDDYGGLFFIGAILIIVGIFFTIDQILDIVTALTLPEKTLLNFAKTIIGN